MLVAVVVAAALVAACGEEEVDPVAVAQRQVDEAQEAVTEAQTAFDDSSAQFCEDSRDYIAAVDRYGKAWDESQATVGDVKTAGRDLEEPRQAVEASAADVVEARDDLAAANNELTEAEAALAEAQTGTTAPAPASTTTTAPLVPPASIDRVEQAESDLDDAFAGITDLTTLRSATAQVNAAAYALELAWLRLFADAGCLTDEQLQQAVTAVSSYVVSLQTSLQTAGYYSGALDGIYGPETVAAVEQLQTDSGLPVTGLVDQVTSLALTAAVTAAGGQAATDAVAHTAAVQSTLALAGYWNGPVDGQWTPELTEALMAFQTALGVPATGMVDAATLHALQTAIAEAQNPPPETTTTAASTSTTTG
jgi:peptidoglycan hydrolase-like protein with peptidoglycan-binding domain